MNESYSVSLGISKRYGAAIFALAKEAKALGDLESDLSALKEILNESSDFSAFINSPIVTRDEQALAIEAICQKMKLSKLTANALGLMASKRRLFILPALQEVLQNLIDEEKGVVTAEVTSAKALTKAQADKLARLLKAAADKDVKISQAVDESLIGGLVVKLGSRMVDSSIKTKLTKLKNSMKEAG